MRKLLVLCISAVLLPGLLTLTVGEAEPLGFGYIQTQRTNLREAPRERVLFTLDAGDSVYVTEQATDSQGTVWYRVNTERDDQPRTAWVQAKFVTAGNDLFHGITQIAAGETGMLALQSDGHVVGVADENVGTHVFQAEIARWRGVKQVACGFMTYLGLRDNGALYGFGNLGGEKWNSIRSVRLLAAESGTIAFVTEDGVCNLEADHTFEVLGTPPDWRRVTTLAAGYRFLMALQGDGAFSLIGLQPIADEYRAAGTWTNLAAVDAGVRTVSVRGQEGRIASDLLVALRKDGTVLLLPDGFAGEVKSWTNLADVKAGWDYVLGLRRDGTVVAAGEDAAIVAGVQGWRDIVAIDGAIGFCVGLRKDGTLVFAGAYQY